MPFLEIGMLFLKDLFQTFIEFLYAPIIFPEMLWILIPVSLSIILMEIYFYRYPRDSLGHHKFLENTIFLLFISFDLARYILINKVAMPKIYAAVFFIVIWILIAVLDFMHKLPTSLFYKIPSKMIIAYTTYIAIIMVYSDILDTTGIIHFLSVLLSTIFLLFTLFLVKAVMVYLEPKSYEQIEHFLHNIERDIKKISEDKEEHHENNKSFKKT